MIGGTHSHFILSSSKKKRSPSTMPTIILLFILFLLSIILGLLLKTRNKRKTPPGPVGFPFIGNIHQLTGVKHTHKYFWDLSKKYGPLLFLKLGSRPVLVANSSRTAEEILKKQDLLFCSRPPLRALRRVSYDGLDMAFSSYNEYWREVRKVAVLHLLSTNRVKSFRRIREDEVSRLVEMTSEEGSRSEGVNLSEKLLFMTSTIISRSAFGKRYEQGSRDRNDFNEIILEFQAALSSFFLSDYFPWLEWVDRITGKIDHLEGVFKKWDAFYQQLIDEHQSKERPKSMDGDVLDIMLKLREETSESMDLSMDRIKAVLVDVYFASTDTIATTLTWAMTALIKNPSAMKKAQAELRSIGNNKRMLDEEDITAADLPYFRASIGEAMRMYTTIPLLLPRETMAKCTIDGYEIPEKTMVHVNVWAVARDPEMWENPSKFSPERFLTSGNKLDNYFKGKDFGFLPFGSGRRGCPGITMALATVELALANLLYVFDWELPYGVKNEEIDDDALPGMTLHKKNALFLVPKRVSYLDQYR